MAEMKHVKQGMTDDQLTLYRGFVLLCSMLTGMAVTFGFALQFFQLSPYPTQGIVGYFTLGLKTPHEAYQVFMVVAGGIIGIFLGEWLWSVLAHLQRQVSSLTVNVALKRAAVIFAPGLALVNNFTGEQTVLAPPMFVALLLTIGFLLLAWFEKKDKRKIYFAFPTENRYRPAALFIHGSVIVLGTGLGWFIQSLSVLAATAQWGIWFALALGVLVWIVSLLLTFVLNQFYSKLTFDQVFLVLAFSLMPLALLPLQTLEGLTYLAYGQVVAVNKLAWLSPLLAVSAGGLMVLILILQMVRLSKQKIEIEPTSMDVFQALMLIIPVPLILYAVAYWPLGAAFSQHQLLGPVDMFHEGEPLGIAQSILLGRLPFNDILFRHGFIADAVSGLAAINWLGGTLESYRMMLSYLAPLGLIVIYIFAIFCMPWIWALLLTLTLLTGTLGLVPYTRFLFPLVGFIFTLFYLQSNRWYLLIFSGVMTAVSVIASYTAGVMAMTGQLTLLLVYLFVGQHDFKKRAIHFGIYFGSTIAALLPWILYLAMSGSIQAYFKNFAWVMKYYAPVFGLPLPGLGQSPDLIDLLRFALPAIVMTVGGVISLKSVFHNKTQRQIPWNILLLTVITALYWMRFLTRSHYPFLLEALPIAAMLATFFIYRLTIKQLHLKGVIFALLLVAVLVPQSGKLSLFQLANGFATKTNIKVNDLVKPKSLLMGNVYLPTEQAQAIDELVSYLNEQVATSETFFDFTNQPLLYFLVPRRPVTQSLSAVTMATFEQQLEAIHQLESHEVKVVVNDGRPLSQAGLDNIPSELRQYAVSEYLLARYVPIKQIGQQVIMLRKQEQLKKDPVSTQALKRLVDFQRLPLVMAKDSKYAIGQGNRIDQFKANGIKAVEAQGMTVTAQGDGIKVHPGIGITRLKLTSQQGLAKQANVIVMSFTASPELDGRKGELIWGKKENREGLRFTIIGDGQEQLYVFRVGGLPSWALAEKIEHLVLTLPGGGWHWQLASCLKINDIEELKEIREHEAESQEKTIKE